MSYNRWPKRDPIKNYFPVPNEIFSIGLNYREISLYCYLLRLENRETYQCWPSYKTIGKALGMSENTVSKYVHSLEDKALIRTEPTTVIWTTDGRPMNGNLRYTILPIQCAVDLYHERQMEELARASAQQMARAQAERLGVTFTPSDNERSA